MSVTFIFEPHGKYFCHRKASGVWESPKSEETENDDSFVKQLSTDHAEEDLHGLERIYIAFSDYPKSNKVI